MIEIVKIAMDQEDPWINTTLALFLTKMSKKWCIILLFNDTRQLAL